MSEETAGEPSEDPSGRKRRWWIAGMLSFCLPGLGQFYNTDYRWAKRFFAAFIAVNIALILSGNLVSTENFAGFSVLIALLALTVLVWLVALGSAVFRARRFSGAILTKWHRPIVYIGCAVVAIALPQFVNLNPMRAAETEMYNIPTGSGLPNLMRGDHLVAVENAQRLFKPERGQIWVFKSAKDGKTNFIKRVIGVPGDTIQYRRGRVYLNGTVLAREIVTDLKGGVPGTVWDGNAYIYRETLPSGVSYLIREATDNGVLDDTRVYSVPDAHYFVLGDNRDDTLDSRVLTEVGYVPAAKMRDFPMYLYWSRNLSRVGHRLQPVPKY